MADQVLPTVRLIFTCDVAAVDPTDTKWVLKHPWSVVMLPEGAEFPFRLEDMWVYLQLTDGVGVFDLAVELCQVMDDDSRRWVGRSASLRVELPGGQQLLAFDRGFRLARVPFREAGIYEVRAVVGDGNVLHGMTAQIRVIDRWA